jgi:hypothetical protein
MSDAAELVQSGKVDAFAANKANLFASPTSCQAPAFLRGGFLSTVSLSDCRRAGKLA